MPVKISQQFNRPVVALMDEAAANFQVLQIKLNGDGIKQLDRICASYISQVNVGGAAADAQTAIGNTFIQGRVIVIGEEVDISNLPIANLTAFNPFTAVAFPELGISNILFDLNFINFIDVYFTPPIDVAEGTACSILLSQGIAVTDVGTGSTVVKVGSLNVNGKYKSSTESSFYNLPR